MSSEGLLRTPFTNLDIVSFRTLSCEKKSKPKQILLVTRPIFDKVLPALIDNVEKSKDLFVRHGSILAVGQIVLGMSKVSIDQPLEDSLGASHIERIKGIVSR